PCSDQPCCLPGRCGVNYVVRSRSTLLRRGASTVSEVASSVKDPRVIEDRLMTVGAMFLDRVRRSGDREALRHPVGDGWESLTWSQVGERVSRLAAGLVALGVEPQQRVGIASSTRYEWVLADLAIMCAGAATTTVYPTTVADDVAYILADSACRVLFAEDAEQLQKVRERRGELPELRRVVVVDPPADAASDDDEWVMSLRELE